MIYTCYTWLWSPWTKRQCSRGADLLSLSEYRINKYLTGVQRQPADHCQCESTSTRCILLGTHYSVYINPIMTVKKWPKRVEIPTCTNCLTKNFLLWVNNQPTNWSGFASGNLATVAPCWHIFSLSTVICFFSSSKILSKKNLHKIIFGQPKLNENNLQVACGGH